MSATEAISFLTQLLLAGILLSSLASLLRARTAARLDVFLLFLTLGASSLIGLVGRVAPVPTVIEEIGSVLIVVHPFFVLRILHSMRAAHSATLWPALIGGVVSAVWYLIEFPEIEGPALAFIVVYIGIADLYAGYAMVRGTRTRSGVSALRLRLGALGLALLGVVILFAGIQQAVAEPPAAVAVSVSLLTLAAIAALFLSFAPPRWLVRTWLNGSVAAFARSRTNRSGESSTVDAILDALISWTSPVTGTQHACLARWDVEFQRLRAANGATGWLEGRLFGADDHLIWDVWQARKSGLLPIAELDDDLKRRLLPLGITHLYLARLSIGMNEGGVLLMPLMGNPLFPDDELRLVDVLCELTEMELGHASSQAVQAQLIGEMSVINDRLAQSNKELESFSYTVSHDLRAPLRAINGFVTMVIDSEAGLSAEGIRRLDVARDSATKLGLLIDGILAFSRLGRQNVYRRPVNLKAIVEEVAKELLAGAPPERRIDIRVSPAIPECSADPVLIKQVFVNLLSNAVKFTREREHAIIDVDVTETPLSGQVAIRVRDNGIGFDMRYADRIFGVFERVHDATGYEGTGIGLALAKRIVTRHGGMIWALSTPNEGANFYMTLPAAGPEPDLAAIDALASSQSSGPPAPQHNHGPNPTREEIANDF